MYSRTPFIFYSVSLVILLAVLAFLWIPGLGVSPGSGGQTQATGQVTYNGKPVSRGRIVFAPQNRGTFWATANLDSQGRFKLETWSARDELAPGRYDIFFTFNEVRPESTKESGNRFTRAEDDIAKPEHTEPLPSPIPEKYSNPDTSKLWIDIGKEPNRVDIDLKD
jgi:hypothetical protein